MLTRRTLLGSLLAAPFAWVFERKGIKRSKPFIDEAFTPNELREKEGKPPIDDAGGFLVPVEFAALIENMKPGDVYRGDIQLRFSNEPQMTTEEVCRLRGVPCPQ